ncbi:MAG: GDP-mannose 4,6-dehydratase [Candidatus Kapabacteria bacterium]|nr:GDP-mannose 4,6-dehydratase [Candidatus Kapabacteria bacterium]
MKIALITGITGQDGSYLAEYLLSLGYEVHGLIRRASTFNTHRIEHLYKDPKNFPETKLKLHYGDLSDSGQLTDLIYNIKPDEIYNLGAQTHIRVSFDMPEYTGNVSGLGTVRLLEAIRRSGIKTRFYQASSSEMFGDSPAPQNEQTTFRPNSPYAISKLYSYWSTVNYRKAYNLFASNGIFFNHESPRRGEIFVTRKITRALAHIIKGLQKKLFLGNIDAKRDWGYAPEYIGLMHKILQLDEPDDFVVGTGESHKVSEFLEKAFEYCGIELEWKKNDEGYSGVIKSLENSLSDNLKTGMEVVSYDKKYMRPADVQHLVADYSKAKKTLNWEPKIKFDDLVKIMCDFDLLALGLKPKMDGIKKLQEIGLNWTTHK